MMVSEGLGLALVNLKYLVVRNSNRLFFMLVMALITSATLESWDMIRGAGAERCGQYSKSLLASYKGALFSLRR